jgi:PilZ domain
MTKRKTAQVDELSWHSNQADRRASRRFQVGWDVTIRRIDGDGKVINEIGNLYNLSSSGSYISLTRGVKVGDKLEVCIKIPVNRECWIRYSAEVVRLQRNNSGVGIGIKFDKSRPEFVESGLL